MKSLYWDSFLNTILIRSLL